MQPYNQPTARFQQPPATTRPTSDSAPIPLPAPHSVSGGSYSTLRVSCRSIHCSGRWVGGSVAFELRGCLRAQCSWVLSMRVNASVCMRAGVLSPVRLSVGLGELVAGRGANPTPIRSYTRTRFPSTPTKLFTERPPPHSARHPTSNCRSRRRASRASIPPPWLSSWVTGWSS